MKNGEAKYLEAAFLTPKEAADYLRITPRTMYAYLKKPRAKGGPPVRKFGAACYRIPTKEFLVWANQQEK